MVLGVLIHQRLAKINEFNGNVHGLLIGSVHECDGRTMGGEA